MKSYQVHEHCLKSRQLTILHQPMFYKVMYIFLLIFFLACSDLISQYRMPCWSTLPAKKPFLILLFDQIYHSRSLYGIEIILKTTKHYKIQKTTNSFQYNSHKWSCEAYTEFIGYTHLGGMRKLSQYARRLFYLAHLK